jgi:hypothetical protein
MSAVNTDDDKNEPEERIFTINGVRIVVQGGYGDTEGGVYLYDNARNIEIVTWDMREWINEPSVALLLMEAIDYAQTYGVDGVAGRFKPDYIHVNS